MTRFLIVYLLLLTSCANNFGRGLDNLVQAQKYVPGIEDLPVFDGFQPLNDKNMVYDSESGRIIDASYFSNNADKKQVQDFYLTTLEQLGWHKEKGTSYTRDGEKLKLTITTQKNTVLLKFIIRPST